MKSKFIDLYLIHFSMSNLKINTKRLEAKRNHNATHLCDLNEKECANIITVFVNCTGECDMNKSNNLNRIIVVYLNIQ